MLSIHCCYGIVLQGFVGVGGGLCDSLFTEQKPVSNYYSIYFVRSFVPHAGKKGDVEALSGSREPEPV